MDKDLKNQQRLQRVSRALGRRGRGEAGMSLIEIMVVITIIGLMMSVIGVSVLGALEDAKVDTTKSQIKNLENALLQYKVANGRFPTSSEGLDALINPPANAKKKRKFLNADAVPVDAWDNEFMYYSPGTHGAHDYEIISYGSDMSPGGSDADADINSWEIN